MNTIKKQDNKYYITIPFSLKDSFKKAIPSAKWDSKSHQWTVGPRSGKKLEAWYLENEAEINAACDKKAALDEKTSKMVMLTGHTYEIRDELKSRFNAIFVNKTEGERVIKGWMVEPEIAKEAQTFVNSCTEDYRLQKVIESQTVKPDSNGFEILNALKNVIDQFGFNEDFSVAYKSKNAAVEKLVELVGANAAQNFIVKTYRDLSEEMQHGDENDCEFSFDTDNEDFLEFLSAFNLFKHYKINFYNGMIEDNAEKIAAEKKSIEDAKNADKAMIQEAIEKLGRDRVFQLFDGHLGGSLNQSIANNMITTGKFSDNDYRIAIKRALIDFDNTK